MSRSTLLIMLCLFVPRLSTGQDLAPREGISRMVRPFNGVDLTGWICDESRWSVEDGQIVGRTAGALEESTFLLLDGDVSDFRLTFDFKSSPAGSNTGVVFWGKRSNDPSDDDSYTGPLVTLPTNVAVYDLNGSGLLRSITPEPEPEARREPEPKPEPEPKITGAEQARDDWSRVEILAQGNRVRLVVDGRVRLDARLPESEKLLAGPIGLQLPRSEATQEVRFKKLTLELFPEEQLATLDIDEFTRLSQMQTVVVDVDPQTPNLWSRNPAVVIPEQVLADIRAGLDQKLRGLLIREKEAAAYYAFLAKAKRLGTKQLRDAAAEFRDIRRADPENKRYASQEPHEFPTFVDLFKHPEKYHGKPVTFRGHILKLVPTDADENPYGITRLYEAWLYEEDSQSNPAIIISTSRDERLEDGTEILIDHVQVSGYFFKNMAFDGQDQMHFGPLIIADKLEYYPIEDAPRVFRIGRNTRMQLLAGAVIAILIGRYLLRMRRQSRVDDKGRRAVRDILDHTLATPEFDNIPEAPAQDEQTRDKQ